MESEKHFCSSCGKELTPGSSFCTNCGAAVNSEAQTQVSSAQEKAVIAPEQKEVLKQSANNLWIWTLESFKSPTKESLQNPAWFSWLTFGLTALFGALAIDKFITNTLSAVGNGLGAMSGFGGIANVAVANATTGLFVRLIFPLIVSTLIILAAVIFGGWLANFVVLGNKDFTFKKMINFYGRPFVLVLAGIIVTFLFTLIGFNPLATVFGYLSAILLGMIGIYPFMTAPTHHKMDSFYSKLLAYAAYLGILIIAFLIVTAIMSTAVAGIFSNLLGGL